MNEDLANAFVRASQQLVDAMLAQVKTEDPDTAQKIVEAVQRGESLIISCDFSASASIELGCRSDYNTTRRICSIPMRLPAMH